MTVGVASGVLCIAGLSVLAYAGGRLMRSSRVSCWFFAVLFTSLFFAWMLSGRLLWAFLIPDDSVIFLSNLMPLLLSFAAGLAFETHSLTRWSRPIVIACFVLLASAYALLPYVRPRLYPVDLSARTQWSGAVCLQSHASTCAPAAAVTLLRLNGMLASEKELVESCLTSSRGTEPLGLYRGLSIAVRNRPYRARVAQPEPSNWQSNGQLPNISLVRLGGSLDSSGPSTRGGSSRWLLGPRAEGHAVVVLGQDATGHWLIADPAFGTTKWTDQQFRDRFTGDAIYLTDAVAFPSR